MPLPHSTNGSLALGGVSSRGIHYLWALGVAAIITGCAGLQRPAEGWSTEIPPEIISEIPPKAYFVEIYYKDQYNEQLQSEDEYLSWVVRFYQGWGPAPMGWIGFEQDFLRDARPLMYQSLKAELQSLGRLVSSEWAKHQRVRRIDSRMLLIWADVLQEAKRQTKQEESLELISGDVASLVSGQLSQYAIKRQRYVRLLKLATIS